MKYLPSGLVLLLLILLVSPAAQAQKQKRPTKNPPQYPHIIDTGEKKPPVTATDEEGKKVEAEEKQAESQDNLLLVRAVVALTQEVRGLVQELKSLNVRQQSQIDMLRLTRADLRIDQYDRELKATRDRLALLNAEEQNLQIALKSENLELQANSVPTFDRSLTIRQLKANHEARLRVVQAEKETMQQREQELAGVVESLRAAVSETEKRLQSAEETLRQLEKPPGTEPEKKENDPPADRP